MKIDKIKSRKQNLRKDTTYSKMGVVIKIYLEDKEITINQLNKLRDFLKNL